MSVFQMLLILWSNITLMMSLNASLCLLLLEINLMSIGLSKRQPAIPSLCHMLTRCLLNRSLTFGLEALNSLAGTEIQSLKVIGTQSGFQVVLNLTKVSKTNSRLILRQLATLRWTIGSKTKRVDWQWLSFAINTQETVTEIKPSPSVSTIFHSR